jgi:hypothetical protein
MPNSLTYTCRYFGGISSFDIQSRHKNGICKFVLEYRYLFARKHDVTTRKPLELALWEFWGTSVTCWQNEDTCCVTGHTITSAVQK